MIDEVPNSKKEVHRTQRKGPTIQRFHVKIESGTQVASRGPTWRIATPLV